MRACVVIFYLNLAVFLALWMFFGINPASIGTLVSRAEELSNEDDPLPLGETIADSNADEAQLGIETLFRVHYARCGVGS